MTVEDKRARLEEYCYSIKDCEECLAFKRCIELRGCYTGVSDEDVNKNFEIVFGNEDPVNRPSHYTDGKIEVIDYIEDKKLGFCLGNAIKYISRAGKKDPSKEIEDLKKAKWYIERRIKEIEEGIA